ncbi:MAG: phenylalanine--tRNA ligase subunit beta [Solirubrobacterales bacterium]|nr:phenylalanine--tRNA ligase subunit beta [Solirubrobacterales bacterium]
MKLPLLWLNDYVTSALSATELAERLDLTGTEVERISHHGVVASEYFVVGHVLETGPHPDADRLSVCQVDLGDGCVEQIVCGAPNVAPGLTVGVARPGAVMTDATKLKTAKLRGVASNGMILAEDELGIGGNHDGIMVLDDQLKPGTPLDSVMAISSDVLELEITPNRPDCLSIYGVAREVHAATQAPLSPEPWAQDLGTFGPVDGVEVDVQEPALCQRFTARVFEDVKLGDSPTWLKARLSAAGQRPISNVVDITNYVMLVTGQPLHAFDLDQIAGGRLVVRRAGDGESVETLDGQTRELDSEMVVICDQDGPTSIAAVMGGVRSEVSAITTRVLMEAATWDGPNIQRTSTRLALRSEASSRFEKQLSPEVAIEAQALATRLMVELCGATVAAGTIDIGGDGPAPITLRLREARLAQVLGTALPRSRQSTILTALGFTVVDAEDGLDVTVPHFRRIDVTREIDLIEEVARIDGLANLPATLPARRASSGRLSPRQRARRRAQDALGAAGLHEIVGWSFVAPDLADRLRLDGDDPRRNAIAISNPMSQEQSVMRTTLLGSLLDAASHNVARGAADLGLWEMGGVYRHPQSAGELGAALGDGGLPDEGHRLGVLLTGAATVPTWRSSVAVAADFYSAKGVLTGLLDSLRLSWSVKAASQPFLHPGRAGAVYLGDLEIGWLGEIHPAVSAAWDLDSASAFEVDIDSIIDAAGVGNEIYRDLTSFPEVRQDIAVIVSDDVSADRVLEVVQSAAGELLTEARVFDVYRGDQIGPGRVSLALRLTFGASDRTLSDDDILPRREKIAAALAADLGGELRA